MRICKKCFREIGEYPFCPYCGASQKSNLLTLEQIYTEWSIRASVGLGALTWDDGLGDIAAARCRQLMDDFSHNGMTAPEICAMGAPDASSVVSSWQASSAHYAQMVYEGYTRCAVAHCYDGDGCHYWCATFG